MYSYLIIRQLTKRYCCYEGEAGSVLWKKIVLTHLG